MYFWKCWRESRAQFIAGLVVIVAICCSFAIPVAKFGSPEMVKAGVSPSIAQVWSSVTRMILGAWGSMLILIFGLVLGSTGLGKEFDRRTVSFLFTRPRYRRYWVWTGWSAGVSELVVVALLGVGITSGLLVFLTGHFYTWRVLAVVPGLALGGAVAYGLTCFMAVVTRSGRQGLSYAIGILFVAIMVPGMARYFWNIDMPSLWNFMIAMCEWAAATAHSFPFGALILWTIVALAFPLAAQLLVERAEV